MPYFFTCPNCRQNNYGLETPPKGRSFFHDLSCTQCGQKGIYWVESEATAKLVTDQFKAAPRNIAIGAGQSPIAYMDPSVATGSVEQILPRLSRFATLEAPYSQGARTKAFSPKVTAIQEGLCEGQCLHWIRRVLQGGREVYQVQRQKGTQLRSDDELIKHQKKQHIVGAAAQMKLESQNDTARARYSDEAKTKFEAILVKMGFTRLGTDWNIPADKAELWDEAKAKWNIIQKTIKEKGIYSIMWNDLSKELDQFVTQKLRPSKRPFSGIVAVKSLNRAPFDNVGKFVTTLAADPQFQAGTCALLSVGLLKGIGEAGGAITGHAIAVHFNNQGALFLFDPNLGIFQCTSKAAMQRTLETLVGTAWISDLNWRLNGTFGYSLFRRREPEVTETSKQIKPVVYSPSPTVTALENKVQGVLPLPGKIPQTGLGVVQSKTGGPPKPQFRPQLPPKIVTTTPIIPTTPSSSPQVGGRIAALRKNFENK